ncbi:MAG: HAD family phosphatase [Sedimentisphaerales bacterium]|nr:HAD family phosphatase [Sedimentisphaerales bacterium]
MYGLIFDVDGVIADTEAVNVRATVKMFEDLFGLTGVKKEDFEAGLGRGATEYVRVAAQAHGVTLDQEQLKLATAARQENILSILSQDPLPAFPGVLELMSAAMGREDFKVAIATSSARELSEPALRGAKVPYDKMAYITGSDVKNKKPDPELFLKAAAALGLDPSRCVVIEDAPAGVEAAKAAGAKCIAVTNSTSADKLRAADLVVDCLTEVGVETLLGLLG